MTGTKQGNNADERWVSRTAQALLDARRRIEGKDRLEPNAAIDLAVHQLEEMYGPTNGTIATAFRSGVIGYFADHVQYMTGFALFASSKAGLAIAIRPGTTTETRIAIWPEGSGDVFSFGSEEQRKSKPQQWLRLIDKLIDGIDALPDVLDVSVVSAIPVTDGSSFIATLGVAVADALEGLASAEHLITDRDIADAIGHAVGYYQSPAFVTGVRGNKDGMFSLTDSENCDLVNFEITGELAVGYVEIIEQPPLTVSFVQKRLDDAEKCLVAVQAMHPDVPSLAHLRHQDLQNVEQRLPRKLKYVANYLVKENQRVQRAVTASRKGDWQLFGALLFMSNAALISDWGVKAPAASFVVDLVQKRTTDGLVGARINGNGSGVYIIGQPFSVPTRLDEIRKSFKDEFGHLPRTELL